MTQTLFWHDYETWGANPSVDRPSQFAGLRTNWSLDVIDEPKVWYCKPTVDVLPNPEAVLVTGITPEIAERKGVAEPEFIARIHEQMAVPGTCSLGYNSLRFDDEVTRFTLYRNFYDPYGREWQQGNSRWDVIDMVRTCYALKPHVLEWPTLDGKVSFKLELLTQANGLMHAKAHDALSDVEATIALAKRIKDQEPAFFNHMASLRDKRLVSQLINVRERKPLLHVSSKYSAQQGCCTLVAPLAFHPTNKNAVIVFDLMQDPSVLASLNVEEIAERIFTRAEDLPEGVERIGLKAVHLNKSPVLLTPKLVDAELQQRFGLDKGLCERHWQSLLTLNIEQKIQAVFASSSFGPRADVEQQLYDGFANPRDKHTINQVRETPLDALTGQHFAFEDARYTELLLRYKGRFCPEGLTPSELHTWQEICARRWFEGVDGYLTQNAFNARCNELIEQASISEREKLLVTQQWVNRQIEAAVPSTRRE